SLGDPLPQLVIAAHEVVEVPAPEPRHVALQRSGVRETAGTERAMAPEAPEVGGELGAARGARFIGHHLAGCRAQVRDQILEVATVDVAAKRRHAVRRRFHAGASSASVINARAMSEWMRARHILALA